jgi:4-alpha-glucanotransferase
MLNERKSGILLHISSLPSPYGIGTFGKAAYDFVDFLEASGQSYWQVLPFGPTSYGDSPYQVLSVFAGNPYFIDIDFLIEDGILAREYVSNLDFGNDPVKVDYGKLFVERIPLLKKAYEKGKDKYKEGITKFWLKNEYWVEDYALYMILKYKFDHRPYWEWESQYIRRDPLALKNIEMEHQDEFQFWIFVQYLFDKQWTDLKNYANEKGIEIIGDIPIYVGRDSEDVWAHPAVFCLDDDFNPTLLSGVPPDDFSDDGQLWGNPIYDWEYLRSTEYSWWISRFSRDLKLFDNIRLDHFRGFEAYWCVLPESDTAREGTWVKGPGKEFFDCLEENVGDLHLIAENLGFLSPEALKLRDDTGYMGMKILQFAFDGNPENPYLPYNYDSNSAAYPGTHDNDTVMGWVNKLDDDKIEYLKDFLNVESKDEINWGVIRTIFSSVAYIAIIPFQDLLGLDNESRMNIPSTAMGNWTWRMKKEFMREDLALRLKKLTRLYGR